MNYTLPSIIRFVVTSLIIIGVGFLMWYFSSVVIFILVSAVLAIVGKPLVNAIEKVHIKRVKVPSWVAAALTLMVIWVIFGLIFYLIIPLIFNKVYEFATLDLSEVMSSIERPVVHFQEYIQHIFPLPEFDFSISESIANSIRSIIDFDNIKNSLSSVVSLAMSFVIAVFSISFITFFFLKDDGLFHSMVVLPFPEKYQSNVSRALDSVTMLLKRYFSGLMLESLIIAVIISTAMFAFGMKIEDACFIGVIMGVLNVIPYAGPFIGGMISLFVGLVNPIEGVSSGHMALIIIGTLMCTKGFDDFVLQPVIYSSRVKAHPLEIFIVILLAGYSAGILGMLLAIPSYTVLRVFAKEFFSQFSLVQKLTEKI